jgi:hypothetical protein
MDTTISTGWRSWLRRRWLFLALALLGLGQCSLQLQLNGLPQTGAAKTLQVERLEVVNETGQKVIVLGSVEGMGTVAVSDRQGKVRASIEANPKVGHIKLSDDQEKVMVLLGVDSSGNGVVETTAARGGFTHLGASASGTPVLSLITTGADLFLGYQPDNDQEPLILLRQGQETRVRIEAVERSGVGRVWGPGGKFGNVFMPKYR